MFVIKTMPCNLRTLMKILRSMDLPLKPGTSDSSEDPSRPKVIFIAAATLVYIRHAQHRPYAIDSY